VQSPGGGALELAIEFHTLHLHAHMSRNAYNIVFLGTDIVIALALGVGLYTFLYARGYSYFTNDPAACANCHIMDEQYAGWTKSSHHAVAACNDCHTPPGFFGKYMTKASNGFWHSFAFTTGIYPDPLQIKERNREVTEAACRGCHADIVMDIDSRNEGAGSLSCITCHRSVGHFE
jgi:cytochrome c nitrite reductase small subunit